MPFSARAELYDQLATMEAAGLSLQHSMSSLHLPGPGQKRLQAMRKMLACDVEFCTAGEDSGVFTALEGNLLRSAVSAGIQARIYRRLADCYAQRAERVGQLRSKLALPLLALIAALFIRPLPGLSNGVLNVARFTAQFLGSLAVVGAGVFLCIWVPRWLRMGSLDHANLTPARSWVDRNLPRVPLFGAMHIRRNLRDFFETLALMLDAGISMQDALPLALSLVTNSVLHGELAGIAPRIKQGDALSKAIFDMSFVDDSNLLSFVKTGETTSRLPEMLFKYAAEESAALEAFQQQLAVWVPRVIYGAIACWLAYGLLHGVWLNAKLPKNPA